MRVIVTAAAAVLLAAAGSTAAQASPGDLEGWVGCVAQAQKLSSDGTPTSPPKEPVCYDTWEEHASASQSSSAILVARGWDYTNFGGSFIDFVVSSDCPDVTVPYPSIGWGWAYIGSTWDNRISSMRVYANANTKCTSATMYSQRSWTGDAYACSSVPPWET